jgi:hypothetical protein
MFCGCAPNSLIVLTHSLTIAFIIPRVANLSQHRLGRILNRFTYDVEVLDIELSVSMAGLMISSSWLIAAIIVMVRKIVFRLSFVFVMILIQ